MAQRPSKQPTLVNKRRSAHTAPSRTPATRGVGKTTTPQNAATPPVATEEQRVAARRYCNEGFEDWTSDPFIKITNGNWPIMGRRWGPTSFRNKRTHVIEIAALPSIWAEVRRYASTFQTIVLDVRTQFVHHHLNWKPLFDHAVLKWMEVAYHITRVSDQVETNLAKQDWEKVVELLRKPIVIGAMNAFRDWKRLFDAATPRSDANRTFSFTDNCMSWSQLASREPTDEERKRLMTDSRTVANTVLSFWYGVINVNPNRINPGFANERELVRALPTLVAAKAQSLIEAATMLTAVEPSDPQRFIFDDSKEARMRAFTIFRQMLKEARFYGVAPSDCDSHGLSYAITIEEVMSGLSPIDVTFTQMLFDKGGKAPTEYKDTQANAWRTRWRTIWTMESFDLWILRTTWFLSLAPWWGGMKLPFQQSWKQLVIKHLHLQERIRQRIKLETIATYCLQANWKPLEQELIALRADKEAWIKAIPPNPEDWLDIKTAPYCEQAFPEPERLRENAYRGPKYELWTTDLPSMSSLRFWWYETTLAFSSNNLVLKYTSCLNTIRTGERKDCNLSQMVLTAALFRYQAPQGQAEGELWDKAKFQTSLVLRWPYEISEEFNRRAAAKQTRTEYPPNSDTQEDPHYGHVRNSSSVPETYDIPYDVPFAIPEPQIGSQQVPTTPTMPQQDQFLQPLPQDTTNEPMSDTNMPPSEFQSSSSRTPTPHPQSQLIPQIGVDATYISQFEIPPNYKFTQPTTERILWLCDVCGNGTDWDQRFCSACHNSVPPDAEAVPAEDYMTKSLEKAMDVGDKLRNMENHRRHLQVSMRNAINQIQYWQQQAMVYQGQLDTVTEEVHKLHSLGHTLRLHQLSYQTLRPEPSQDHREENPNVDTISNANPSEYSINSPSVLRASPAPSLDSTNQTMTPWVPQNQPRQMPTQPAIDFGASHDFERTPQVVATTSSRQTVCGEYKEVLYYNADTESTSIARSFPSGVPVGDNGKAPRRMMLPAQPAVEEVQQQVPDLTSRSDFPSGALAVQQSQQPRKVFTRKLNRKAANTFHVDHFLDPTV